MVVITELVLVWLGSLATLVSIGIIVPMDRLTNIIMPFIASILWFFVAFSAFDVGITDTDPVVTTAMEPIIYLGIILALSSLVFGIYELIVGTGEEVEDATGDSIGVDL